MQIQFKKGICSITPTFGLRSIQSPAGKQDLDFRSRKVAEWLRVKEKGRKKTWD
jgi:hypothetical protein